ncbi:hypothetical protein BpHYR1_025786 [Brachionus plicatilis]|uniref:Uncharacterized protein n=1 Tax=Brachionus plicatilis TaxID=10195 RepID=A0A3M7R6Q1_BRAPC|nr:hypothetical protein BpHYR1_025786 [Brachionus plicatilis]
MKSQPVASNPAFAIISLNSEGKICLSIVTLLKLNLFFDPSSQRMNNYNGNLVVLLDTKYSKYLLI